MDFNPAIPPPGMLAGHPHHITGAHSGGAMVDIAAAAAAGMYPQQQSAEFINIKSVLTDGAERYQPTALVFDPKEEVLWSGNNGGHITSYYSLGMDKYTSFQVTEGAEVRQLLAIDQNIYALNSNNLCCWSKHGVPQYIYAGDAVQNLQCMLQTSPTSLLVGGHQPAIIELDLQKRCEIRTINIEEPGCAILRRSQHFVCAGDTSGKVVLRDPGTLKAVHTLQAHSGTLSDFDVHSNQLITCGFGNRMNNLSIDRFLMVYDLRMMRAMPPLPMAIDPMWLRFVPTYSNRVCVVSQMGQFQVLEQGAMTPGSLLTYQVQGAPIHSFDISSSCQAMSFADHQGVLHLFTTADEHPVFNTYSQPTEFATMEPLQHSIGFNDDVTPYSLIPMQYPTGQKLASEWPEELSRTHYRRAPKIDPEVTRQMKMVQQVGYAPNPGTTKRNQMPYKGHGDSGAQGRGGRDASNVPESPVGRGEDPFVKVPKRYQKVEIKYSKLGVEDFDFRFYNKTNFAGLETHIPNAYCNAMLQVLYFIEPLRCTLLNHLCDKEFCLSCELGFLFYMLDNQKGHTCQATNFLRAFRTIPEASALSLVLGDAEESMGKANLPRLIQNWSRFIMQQVHQELVEADHRKNGVETTKEAEPAAAAAPGEGKDNGEGAPTDEQKPKYISTDNHPSIIRTLFGMDLENRFKCRCGEVQARTMVSTIVDLQYPDVLQGSTKAQGPQQIPFSSIVERSISLDQPTQAWCNKCEKYQPHMQSKIIRSLPDVLAMNCHLENSRDFEFWKVQEELLKKREDVDPAVILANAMTASRSHIKMCRYGNGCKRGDCKFRHEKDTQELSKVEMDKLIDEWAMDVSWLPFGLRVELTPEGKVIVQNIPDEDMIPDNWDEKNVVYYQLLATTAHIRDPKTGGNLVSNVFVQEKYHQRKERVTCTQWYLFNDFSITPLDKKEEAVHFSLDWKVPCNVFFIRKDINKRHNIPLTSPLTSAVLLNNASLVPAGDGERTFTPLKEDELPGAKDLVGLDAEFVTLNQEEAELRSDGTRSMLKPSQLSVARITCVRGSGPNKGTPFIDDYISCQEQVVDYLTQFSGIKPGDLDPTLSKKHLSTLKATYMKLRHLLDAGVIFVGHGLKKDFRVINLNVPKTQVLDTVDLFRQPRSRMISLKFLAWYFLGRSIQSVTHDSIEDARTALQLLAQYREIEQTDPVARNKLKELYEHGYKLHWKVPKDAAEVEPAAALAGAMANLEVKDEEEDEENSMQDYM